MKRPGPSPAAQPMEPNKVLRIIQLREQGELTFTEIGQLMGMTHMGAKLLYRRWREWATKKSA